MSIYTLEIDSGSTYARGALFDGEKIIKTYKIRTSAKPEESIYLVYSSLFNEDVKYTITTGYGRDLLKEAGKRVTEITYHVQGTAFLNEKTRIVIDLGGQDCKVIKPDNSLDVIGFIMSDKCAAGTGRFIEVMIRILEEDIKNIDEFVKNRNKVNISSMCTVFAENEIISLLSQDVDRGDIALEVIHSIAKRTSSFARRLGLENDVFFTGGLANSNSFKEILSEYLDFKVITDELSQCAGAIGASVIGYKKYKRLYTK